MEEGKMHRMIMTNTVSEAHFYPGGCFFVHAAVDGPKTGGGLISRGVLFVHV